MQGDPLAGIPLFAFLGGDERVDLARLIECREVPAREVLFWVGDSGSEFFVIRAGHLQLTIPDHSGKEMTLATLGPGDFLGELALLDSGPRTATARAQTDCTLLCLGRDAFHKFLHDCPSAAIHMMAVLGKRQRETVDKLRGIRNLNDVMEERLTHWQKLANGIAALAASQSFLVGHAVAFIGWIILNLILRSRGPDPFPFPFLCFWSSTEAIFLSLFILISQNLQSQKDRIRTELEYQVALKAQFEIMQLHRKLDELPQMMREIARDEFDRLDDGQPAVAD